MRLRRSLLHWLWKLPLCLLVLSIVQVLLLRFFNPPFSMFMAARLAEAWVSKDWDQRIAYDWRDADDIAASLPIAIVAAEDQNFASHYGFDFKAIEAARQANAAGKQLRGGSTLTQQLAKNLFLWSGRSWIRKGIEAWYTVLIETLWPKRRILEVYVNIAEFGDGVYGAQAAARSFFGKDAKQLSQQQCARLAAVLPSPRRYNARRPGPYVQRRTATIERRMRQIGGAAYLRNLE